MHLISEVDATNVPNDKTLLLLLGHACLGDLKSASEPPFSDSAYIRQPSVAIPKTKQTLTCYVSQSVFETVGSRRDVLLAPYVLYSTFRSRAPRNQVTLFACVIQDKGVAYTEIFGFKGQLLTLHSSKIGFDISMLQLHRQQDFRDAVVHVFAHNFNTEGFRWPEYVTVHAASPFIERKGLVAAFERLTKLKRQRLVDASNSLLHGEFKQALMPAAITLAALCVVPVVSAVKQAEFDSIKQKYHDVASEHGALPEQSELRMWESRSRFVGSVDSAVSTTSIVTELLQALSRTSRLTGPVAFERLDMNGSTPFELNGKTYNASIEVGLLAQAGVTAEEQTARFAAKLTESLGDKVVGTVDVWDDVITRKVQGSDYYFARFYLLRASEVDDATVN